MNNLQWIFSFLLKRVITNLRPYIYCIEMSTEPVPVPMFEVLKNRFREYRYFPLAAGCKLQNVNHTYQRGPVAINGG